MAFVRERNETTGFSTTWEFRCTSKDEKPKEFDGLKVRNMSVAWEVDTGELYYFDHEDDEWHMCG